MERQHRRGIALRAAAALCVQGCSTSPSQDLLGSFFPAWILCAVAGVAGTIVLRQVFVTLGLAPFLLAPPLTYLGIMVCLSLLFWLVRFGG